MLKSRLLVVAVAGALSLGGPAVASAQSTCVPEEVDANDFIVNGELDLAAYLAAVEAANAACAQGGDGGTLPSTGSDPSALLTIAIGVSAVGAAAFGTAYLRRRSSAVG